MPPIVSDIQDADALFYAKQVREGSELGERGQSSVQAHHGAARSELASRAPCCLVRALLQLRRLPVRLPSLPEEPLRTAVLGPTGEELDALDPARQQPVLVLLHSFDSSSLEWRRLIPRLEALFQAQQQRQQQQQQRHDSSSSNGNGVPPPPPSSSAAASPVPPIVALDLVGWGFTDHAAWRRNPDLPVSAALKREHLECFRQQHLGGRPVVLVGTSLGGTIAADYALAYPQVGALVQRLHACKRTCWVGAREARHGSGLGLRCARIHTACAPSIPVHTYVQAVKRLVLLDAHGFSPGVTPLPRLLATLGVLVLRAVWLRKSANQVRGKAQRPRSRGSLSLRLLAPTTTTVRAPWIPRRLAADGLLRQGVCERRRVARGAAGHAPPRSARPGGQCVLRVPWGV